jgi:hypothetical protein
MLGGDPELADDLRRLLGEEPIGLSCDALAKRLHRRRAAVLAELRSGSCFEHAGRTHGSRWRLARRRGRDSDGTSAPQLPWDGLDPSGVPVSGRRALSASPPPASAVEDARTPEAIPGQTTVYDALGESPAA